MGTSRRGVLSAAAAGLSMLGGCAGLSLGSGGETETGSGEQTTPTETATPTPTPTPTPDPRRNVHSLTIPDDFPVETRLVVPRGGFQAYRFTVPEGSVKLRYRFTAITDEDFDFYGFDPEGFETYERLVIDGADVEPTPLSDVTVEDTNGLVKRLAARFDPGEYYLVCDHTAFGKASHRNAVAGDVELRVEMRLV